MKNQWGNEMTTNEEMISRSARRDDLEPLLSEIRKRGANMFPEPVRNLAADGNVPDDSLWTDVQGASMDGTLSDEQLDRCYAARDGS